MIVFKSHHPERASCHRDALTPIPVSCIYSDREHASISINKKRYFGLCWHMPNTNMIDISSPWSVIETLECSQNINNERLVQPCSAHTDLNISCILDEVHTKQKTFVNSLFILWRARCRSTVNSGNAYWQPLLGKQHVTCFLCGLTPVCYKTTGRLRFLRGLFRGNNSQCNSGCFLCGLFTGYIRKPGCHPKPP
jgi:hypothetical protein